MRWAHNLLIFVVFYVYYNYVPYFTKVHSLCIQYQCHAPVSTDGELFIVGILVSSWMSNNIANLKFWHY
jgi:hypothetical protein